MGTRVENLAMLYQGALTAAVRIQSQRQQIGNAAAFRRRMKDVLAEIDREARKGKPLPSDHAPLVIDIDNPGHPFDAGWASAESRIAARSRKQE